MMVDSFMKALGCQMHEKYLALMGDGNTLGSLELVGEKSLNFVSLLLVLESATASSC
jgi:hypothetical protein